MKKTIELIEETDFVIYRLKTDKKAITILKEKLKNLGIEKEIEIKYKENRTDVESTLLKIGIGDEILKIEKKVPHQLSKNKDHYIKQKVIVKNYSILYHILFGKYRIYNSDILKTLYLYLTNNYGIKDEKNEELFQSLKTIQQWMGEPLEIVYDNYLSLEQKKEIIEDFLNTFTFIPLYRNSLTNIYNKIDTISKINIKSKTFLLKEIENYLLTARKNTTNLEFLNQKLNILVKKIKK